MADSEKKDDDNPDDKISQDYGTVITVTWSNSGASVDNTAILPVSIDGGHVVIGNPDSQVEETCVILKGSCSDGSIKLYNGKKMQVVFEGVNLSSSRGPAFNCQCRKHIYVSLADGSENYLSDASAYTDVPDGEDAKACMFSEGQLIFSGEGTLHITSLCAHALASDDYVRIDSGNLLLDGAKDGIHVNDHFRMDGGTLEIEADSDGI